ncbi:hypothetical protein KIPB_003011 [Kipferlia bialata]|uniref:Uncharacterized protein n=1 Tax=Kipferlia bialata TaxID=797122 RepID=A0A9K3GGE5_9EUKA|nr:hypothetical protein KIPB_003011 [Kipferlia bialata]|eukprot:g3011.t1
MGRLLVIGHTVWNRQKDKSGKWDRETEEYLWRVHYEACIYVTTMPQAYLSPSDLERLRGTCRVLVRELDALEYGSTRGERGGEREHVSDTHHAPLPVPSVPAYSVGPATRDALVSVLTLWAQLDPINYTKRCQRLRLDRHHKRLEGFSASAPEQLEIFTRPVSHDPLPDLEKAVRKVARTVYGGTNTTARFTESMEKHLDCIVHGSFSGPADSASVCNPTMYRGCDLRPCLTDPTHCPLWSVQYGTQPLMGMPGEGVNGTVPPFPKCKIIFRDWMRSLYTSMESGRADFTLLFGDCIQILLERVLGPTPHSYPVCKAGTSPRPFLFDHIECSNIADYVGLLSVLTVAPAFLRTPGVSCITLVLMIIRASFLSVGEYLQDATGVRVRDLPHVLGVRCVGEEEEIDRGSAIMATSVLPYKCNRVGRGQQNTMGGSDSGSYTHLVFTSTPSPSPAPCIDLEEGEQQSHVHQCLMGILHKCLPHAPNHLIGHIVPTMASFAAVVAVGCRRGLYLTAELEGCIEGQQYIGVPLKSSGDSTPPMMLGGTLTHCHGTGTCGGKSFKRGRPHLLALYPVDLACPFPHLLATLCGTGTHRLTKMVQKLDGDILPPLLACLTEYGIDTRSAGSLSVRVDTAIPDPEGYSPLDIGTICGGVTIIPRHLVCSRIDLSSPGLLPTSDALKRGEGVSMSAKVFLEVMSTLDRMPGIFALSTPTVLGRVLGGPSRGAATLGSCLVLASSEDGSAVTLALHGVQQTLEPLESMHAQIYLSTWSPLREDEKAYAIPGALRPISGPVMNIPSSCVSTGISGVMTAAPIGGDRGVDLTEPVVEWVRAGDGSRILKCECDIPDSIPDSYVQDRGMQPVLRPVVEEMYSLPSEMDQYLEAGTAKANPSTTCVDVYTFTLHLGERLVATIISPVPVHCHYGVSIQISRKRRLILVSVRAAPYTVPAHIPGGVVSLKLEDTPIPAGSQSLEDSDVIFAYGDCMTAYLIQQHSEKKKTQLPKSLSGESRTSESLGMSKEARERGEKALVPLGFHLGNMMSAYLQFGSRLFPIKVPSGVVAAVFIHDFYLCDNSCVLDVSVVLRSGVPPEVAKPILKGMTAAAGTRPIPISLSDESMTLLAQSLNLMKRNTVDAPVHPAIKKHVPAKLHKHVVRLGMRPLHPVMVRDTPTKAQGPTTPAIPAKAMMEDMIDPAGWMKNEALRY